MLLEPTLDILPENVAILARVYHFQNDTWKRFANRIRIYTPGDLAYLH